MAMNLGMTAGIHEPEVLTEMNTTPLIDVMLVLLVMLIITIPIQSHAVKMDLPTGHPPPLVAPPPVVDIDIDFDGSISWNGVSVPDRAALDARIRSAAAQAVQPEVHLRPNKLVAYRYVAEVMADSQRLGLKTIGIVDNR
ncbi:MAG: biopolymer transporter ExbD [Betaproteobacteria bacterium]|nr:biopolymer transporter ExbD [Betaproteobacteria bacterium]MBU6510991.1 biopolymer transporter ExbD [Betaproteobacteria bacterium]MDE1956067.1 biopolymer transporter ExbD [Betaproteobacteria bacterium]MDE2150771.1 biopolymer transporter ExbD [Betaproteobacteria bacterium]MDE2479370.1 biopolymer transporter ExbD [Betaproteobacteria bacterium]